MGFKTRNSLQCKYKRYVFKDAEECNFYLKCLLEAAGPVHALMGMLRSVFGARTFQLQSLRRKDIDIGEEQTQIYLYPMKGFEGEWAVVPPNVHALLKQAATEGIETQIVRKNGNRPPSATKVVFQLTGGPTGKGCEKEYGTYVFKPAFSGTYNVTNLHISMDVLRKPFIYSFNALKMPS